MKSFSLLIVGMVFVALYNAGGPVLQDKVSDLIGTVNPDSSQAFTLITQTGENWNNVSRTISNALDQAMK